MEKLILTSVVSGKELEFPLKDIRRIEFDRIEFDGEGNGLKTGIVLILKTGKASFVATSWEMTYK